MTLRRWICDAEDQEARLHQSVCKHLAAVVLVLTCTYCEAAERYVRTSCDANACYWSVMIDKAAIEQNAHGTLVRATAVGCATPYLGKSYPRRYGCREQETSRSQYVAFCSPQFPSIAFKTADDKWQRTKLSISSDGEFRDNGASITQYLRICHGYVRGRDSLDMIGAKLGYKSRAEALGDAVHDTVDTVSKLVE